jgi:hypothetical protein
MGRYTMKVHIWTPDYQHSSGGIRVLHYLGYLAHIMGHEVNMLCSYLNFNEWGNYSRKFDDFDLKIVPEIYPATLKSAGNIIRWVLYFPGMLCNGPKTYPEHEMIVSYHPNYTLSAVDAAPGSAVYQFYLPYSNLEGFEFQINRSASSLLWVGKGQYVVTPETMLAKQITREWPGRRFQLISALRSCENFYSFDPFTSLNDEALVCGCKVFLFNPNTQGWEPYSNPDAPLIVMNQDRDKMGVDNFLKIAKYHFDHQIEVDEDG